MTLLERVLTTSILLGAVGTIIGGIIQLSKSTVEVGVPRKIGACRVCDRRGYTEWHHIISRGHAKKTKQLDLITNPGNVVELCKSCHNQTTASKSWYLLQNKNR